MNGVIKLMDYSEGKLFPLVRGQCIYSGELHTEKENLIFNITILDSGEFKYNTLESEDINNIKSIVKKPQILILLINAESEIVKYKIVDIYNSIDDIKLYTSCRGLHNPILMNLFIDFIGIK